MQAKGRHFLPENSCLPGQYGHHAPRLDHSYSFHGMVNLQVNLFSDDLKPGSREQSGQSKG
jgi:hypothetical protein